MANALRITCGKGAGSSSTTGWAVKCFINTSPIVAPANGTVIKAGWTGGYGNMIEIDHGNGLTTRYGHLSKINVEIGDSITRGQLIALIGSTGRSTGPHLHFELRLNDKAINPRFLLPPEPTDLTKIAG